MVGLQLLRQSVEKILSEGGDIDRQELEQKLKVYSACENFTQEDSYILFNSGIYNDIVTAYCEKALQNVGLSDRAGEVRQELHTLLDTIGAEKIRG